MFSRSSAASISDAPRASLQLSAVRVAAGASRFTGPLFRCKIKTLMGRSQPLDRDRRLGLGHGRSWQLKLIQNLPRDLDNKIEVSEHLRMKLDEAIPLLRQRVRH
jgi:hypothetical protein